MASVLKRYSIALCACMAAFTAVVPFTRAFFHLEVSYNEGWNVYNATALANHHALYPARYGWTSVNYPMLSFAIFACLHRLTHDYLFTARIVSLLALIACSFLIAAVVQSLNTSWKSAILAGLFCFAVFCSAADLYVGSDDPQMLAQVFFLLGFLIYIRHRRNLAAIALAALIFAIAGSIKHNPIDFPLAVLVDLIFISAPRALWFGLCGIVFILTSVLLNIHFGGPYFLGQLLSPRSFSALKILQQLINVLGPLLLPFCVALFTAYKLRNEPNRRIASILLVTAFLLCGCFSGGKGVSINTLFSVVLAMTILLGLFWDDVLAQSWHGISDLQSSLTPIVLFAWLIIPLILSGNWLPLRALHRAAAAQTRFEQDVASLQDHPGPALCESLLECDLAGKPYLYDPFNATRLIHFHKLNPGVLIEQIRLQRFSAIQTDDPLPTEDRYDSERWAPSVRAAIEANYIPALRRKDVPSWPYLDTVIYLPKAVPR